MTCRSPHVRSPRATQGGFSFLELLTVMGAMAVLMGLTVGYLGNVGKGSEMAQARRLLVETGQHCVNSSVGSQRAYLTLSKGPAYEDPLRMTAGIARTVLTYQFETLEFASGARQPSVEGSVKLAAGKGHTGNAASFLGGTLEFGAESLFAMSEGLQFEAWIQPQADRSTMSLLRGVTRTGSQVYDIELVRSGNSAAFDLRLRILTRAESESVRTQGDYRIYETKGAPIAADGSAWVHVAVSFDGGRALMSVSGHPVPLRDNSASALDADKKSGPLKIAIPPSGTVKLSIGNGYRGLMDSLILRGVFRSSDYELDLPDRMKVLSPSLPIRVEWVNGRLAGQGSADIVIWIQDEAHPNDMPLRLTYGRTGTVEAKYVDRPAPTSAGPAEKGGAK